MKIKHELAIFFILLAVGIFSLAIISSHNLVGRSVYTSNATEHAKLFGDYIYEFFQIKKLFFSQEIKENDCALVAEEFLANFLKEAPAENKGFMSTGINRIANIAFEGSGNKNIYGNFVLIKGNQFFKGNDSNFAQIIVYINRLVHTIKDTHVVELSFSLNGTIDNDKIMISKGNFRTDVIDCSF